MKIWQTAMAMRADAQGGGEVYTAMHDAIMCGWEPPFVKPSCVISFQVDQCSELQLLCGLMLFL